MGGRGRAGGALYPGTFGALYWAWRGPGALYTGTTLWATLEGRPAAALESCEATTLTIVT